MGQYYLTMSIYICGHRGEAYRLDKISFSPDMVFKNDEDYAEVNLLALSNNGLYLAGADRSWGKIVIWETKSGVIVKKFNSSCSITALSFGLNDNSLLVGLETLEILVFEWASFDKLIETQKERFKDSPLSKEEKRIFLLD